MRVLVTGVGGQLGHDLVLELEKRGLEAIGVDVAEMDLTDPEAVARSLEAYSPQVIAHCAAYTAVDRAESEMDLCMAVNQRGTAYIAEYCQKTGCTLIYISTDYVFDGQGVRPWKPEDTPSPLNTYGLSKRLGEQEILSRLEKYFIVRTSWVFGKNGNNFVKTMLRLGGEREKLSVVDDQYGAPTYTRDLAVLLADMAQSRHYGIYHACNSGVCSWREFAQEIMSQAGLACRVEGISSDQYPVQAKRPANSRLDMGKLEEKGFALLPHWKDALIRYLGELEA